MRTTYKKNEAGEVEAFLTFKDTDTRRTVRLGLFRRSSWHGWVWCGSMSWITHIRDDCPIDHDLSALSLKAAKTELEARLFTAIIGERDWTNVT